VEAKTDSKKEETTAPAAAAAEPAKKVEESSDAAKTESTAAAPATSTEKKDDTAAPAAATETKVEAAAEAPKTEEPAAAAATEEVAADATTTEAAAADATTTEEAAAAAPDNRNRRVYVGNLAWGVSWQDLKDHMKTTGFDVNRANIMMTPDGRSKGCGIVEFATAEGAEKAVETLNDTELAGRQIFVREDREDRGGGSGGGGGGGGYRKPYRGGDGGQQATAASSSGDPQNNNASSTTTKSGVRVYVGNLSWDVAWQDLKDHMRQAGEVVTADVIAENNGRSKGCGIVEFATVEEAQEAIKTLTDTELKGRMIFVREDRETSGGGSGGRGGGYGGRGGGRGGRGRGRGRYRGGRGGGGGQQHNNHNNDGGGGEGGESSGGGGGGCQLFVGQLSYDTTWKELKDHFRQCGDVERAEVMSNMDGRSKGFGTVRFYNQKDATSAINRLNGVELQGRSLVVRIDSKAN